MISVCIPVGPEPHFKTFLPEALESLLEQTLQPAGIVIIDDMAGLSAEDIFMLQRPGDVLVMDKDGPRVVKEESRNDYFIREPYVRVWRSPWRLGIPAVANIGIALGPTDWVFQFSCDDKLKPDCLEECWKEWERRKDPLGYYWVGVEYSTGETQALPCGHAMVTKQLWRHTGGFPVETAVGGCDAALVSILLEHHGQAGTLYAVAGGRPLYWHREHDKQYTKHQNAHPDSILDVRGTVTKRWKPNTNWGRYEP